MTVSQNAKFCRALEGSGSVLIPPDLVSAVDESTAIVGETVGNICKASKALYTACKTFRGYEKARDNLVRLGRPVQFRTSWDNDPCDNPVMTEFRIRLPSKVITYLVGNIGADGVPYAIRIGFLPYAGGVMLQYGLPDQEQYENLQRFAQAMMP